MTEFNSFHDDGRPTRVLLHLQHAFEMLLKAALVQGHQSVFDKKTQRSIGFAKCVNLGGEAPLSLTSEEAGTLRTIDELRDQEQHWLTVVDEDWLYLYTRAGVTLFDDLLHRVFADRLADHLPTRVLPVGTEPPADFQTLVDREYTKIAGLLQPGRRARAEADGRVRALLAMEALVDPEVEVSEADVRRVVRGIQADKPRAAVFPALTGVGTDVAGTGVTVEVRIVKQAGIGVPVRLVGEDEDVDAAAIREVSLHKKYHWGPADLAEKLGLSPAKAKALRAHLGIDDDVACVYTFEFKKSRHVQYSDNALTRMREALKSGIDMGAIWQTHGSGKYKGTRPVCRQPGCSVVAVVAS